MQLNQAQIDQFNETGYLILPALFSPDEISRMAEEADRLLNLTVNTTIALGERHCRLDCQIRKGKINVRKLQPINDLSEYLAQVSNDERLLAPMRQLMGVEPVLMEEKLNYKQLIHENLPFEPFETHEYEDLFPLHHDWGYYRQQGYTNRIISSAISIDDSTNENGPLRVVPGTHTKDWPLVNADPQSGDGRVLEELFGEPERIPCLAPAGSVMLFHSQLLHDSCPNNTGEPRRIMIYSHYPADEPHTPDERNAWGRSRGQAQEALYYEKVKNGEYQPLTVGKIAQEA